MMDARPWSDEVTEISVGLPGFAGPLDVLLSLVRRNQYPLEDLPVGQITEQFLAWLRSARGAPDWRLDSGGEFIEVASWLVLLKSRSLLPALAEAEAPANELSRVLVDYDGVRASVGVLGGWFVDQLAEGGVKGIRDASDSVEDKDDGVMNRVSSVLDVVEVARQALARARTGLPRYDSAGSPEPTVEEQIAKVRGLLLGVEPLRGVSTREWFAAEGGLGGRVSLFLALLELARRGELLVHQGCPESTIVVARLTG